MPESATVTEAVLTQVAQDVHANANIKGFWTPPQEFLAEINTKLMLIVSEVAEAMEVLRLTYTDSRVNPYSKMTDDQTEEFCEELADVVIRTLDLAQYFDRDIGETIIAKIQRNAERPHMHGKRF